MELPSLLSLAVIGLLGIACQWLAWWARQPAILLLLLAGIIMGPLTGVLRPDELFGDLLFPVISLSVAVILFEGSLTLRFDEIRGLTKVVRNLITVGALLSWMITAAAAHFILGFDRNLALLFGAVVVVTGPTVIIPLLRTVRPNANIAGVLRWEGIVIDPLGALLSVLVFEFIISSQISTALGHVLLAFGRIVVVGALMGFLFAHALGFILRRHLVPEFLRNVLVLTLVFGVYAASDLAAHESGLLAVTLMGMTLANMKDTDIEDILDFKESLSVLLISGLFIILAARIQPDKLFAMGWGTLALLAVVLFLSRPVAVFASTLGSDLNFRERLLIAWIGPRGIVAAAVSAVFAIRLGDAGFTGAGLLVPLTFLIIIGTVVIQSVTAKYLAHWLGVREPPPRGVLIVGAGIVARALGKALREREFKVMLTDSSWENCSLARMDGLDAYYGNPISEHADRNLLLTGLGKMLGMSGRAHLDMLASQKFKAEFGPGNVYELISSRESVVSEKHKVSTRHRGRQLFGRDITHGRLAGWLRAGAEIRSTQLREEFDFAAYLARYAGHCVPLFTVDDKDRLQFFTADDGLQPQSGWTVVSLILPEGETYEPPREEAEEQESGD